MNAEAACVMWFLCSFSYWGYEIEQFVMYQAIKPVFRAIHNDNNGSLLHVKDLLGLVMNEHREGEQYMSCDQHSMQTSYIQTWRKTNERERNFSEKAKHMVQMNVYLSPSFSEVKKSCFINQEMCSELCQW